MTADHNTEPVAQQTASAAASRLQKWLPLVALTILLVLSAGAASWLYFSDYRADQQVNANAQQQVLTAAATGAEALLSYTPETLDADFTNAKSLLTGDFLSYYTKFTSEIVTPAATEKQVRTSAAVTRKAIVDIEPGTAQVLLFINQTTTSKENPDGAFSSSAVKVTLEKPEDRWLISAVDPV